MSLIEMLYWVKYITIITHGLEILYWFKYLKVLLFQLIQANDAETHMGNETVHRVVCPFTNRGLPIWFFLHEICFDHFVQKYLKGWFPGQILLSSSDIGKVKSIKLMALPARGRFTTVWVLYTFKSTWSHTTSQWDSEFAATVACLVETPH